MPDWVRQRCSSSAEICPSCEKKQTEINTSTTAAATLITSLLEPPLTNPQTSLSLINWKKKSWGVGWICVTCPATAEKYPYRGSCYRERERESERAQTLLLTGPAFNQLGQPGTTTRFWSSAALSSPQIVSDNKPSPSCFIRPLICFWPINKRLRCNKMQVQPEVKHI